MPPNLTGVDLGTASSEGNDGDGNHLNGGRQSNDEGQKSRGTSASVDPEGFLLASASFGGRSHVSADHAAAVDPAGVLLASASFCYDGRELNDHERNTPFDQLHLASASFGNQVSGGDVPGNYYGIYGNADGAGQGENSARRGGRRQHQEAARDAFDAPADEDGDGLCGGDGRAVDEPRHTLPEDTLRALAALHAIAEGSDGDETGSAASARSDDGPAAWGAGTGPVAESGSFSSASTEVVSNRSRLHRVPPWPAAESRSLSSTSTEVVSNRSRLHRVPPWLAVSGRRQPPRRRQGAASGPG